MYPVQATVEAAVEIGAFTVDAAEIPFQRSAATEPGIGNLGGAFLKSFVLTYDSAGGRVLLERG